MKLTKKDKVAIAKRARKLINKAWAKGEWEGLTRKGNPSYCIEGACNRAAIDVLGYEAAIELGAARRYPTVGTVVARDGHFTKRLSIARAARAAYQRKFGPKKPLRIAGQLFNDHKDTRKKDVLAVFDAYIAEHEA